MVESEIPKTPRKEDRQRKGTRTMGGGFRPLPPILAAKEHQALSVFRPENLLREARRQKGLKPIPIPEICVLDPDGDIVRYLRRAGAQKVVGWACYHTEMIGCEMAGKAAGFVGSAVGAPFAVLVAEQMFACGCKLLLSVSSAGRIGPGESPPWFVLIERALRDEGTSYHYLPPSADGFAAMPAPELLDRTAAELTRRGVAARRGASWTTDAPFRETAAGIAMARAKSVLAVEMEAAALYAFATARGGLPVLCIAHVTNDLAQTEGDFEKGEAAGSEAALRLIGAIAAVWS